MLTPCLKMSLIHAVLPPPALAVPINPQPMPVQAMPAGPAVPVQMPAGPVPAGPIPAGPVPVPVPVPVNVQVMYPTGIAETLLALFCTHVLTGQSGGLLYYLCCSAPDPLDMGAGT